MDSTFFLFFETTALLTFFYSIERDTWHGLLIFLSFALFTALSLASFDITQTQAIYNATAGEIAKSTVSYYDPVIAYINEGMAALSFTIGVIKILLYKDTFSTTNETD